MGSVQAATPHSRLWSPRASAEDSPGLVLWVSAAPGVALGAGRALLQALFIAWWPEARPVGPSTLVCCRRELGVFCTQVRVQVRGHGEQTGPGEGNKM